MGGSKIIFSLDILTGNSLEIQTLEECKHW